MIGVQRVAVVLDADDADYLVRALDLLVQMLADQHSTPAPRLATAIDQLRKASRKCGVAARNATAAESSQADQTKTGQGDPHATVTTVEAAQILGISPSGVRALARRGSFGSQRVGSRWRHDLARVEHRAARKRRG